MFRGVALVPTVAIIAVCLPGVCDRAVATQLDFRVLEDKTRSDVVVLDIHSEYCNSQGALGPVCKYDGINKTVVIPTGFKASLGMLEVEVHNAHKLQIHPICISWVQVYNAGLVKTLPPQPGEQGGQCRTWLRMYGSRAASITHGVKDLTLFNCDVGTIDLLEQRDFMAINSTIRLIKNMSWRSYRGRVYNTSIGYVASFDARDSLRISFSNFSKIVPYGFKFSGNDLDILNTTFSQVDNLGMTFTKGIVRIENVVFEYLQQNAITAWAEAFVVMKNVSIRRADAPCFSFNFEDRVIFNNVTASGQLVNFTSRWVASKKSEARFEAQVRTAFVGEHMEECHREGLDLICDFLGSTQALEFSETESSDYSFVNISNAKNLLVADVCNTNINLTNVSGSYFQLNASFEFQDECSASLYTSDTLLLTLASNTLSRVFVNSSIINKLHLARDLREASFRNSVLVNIEKLSTLEGIGVTMENVSVETAINVTFRGPLEASSFHMYKIGSMVFDHSGHNTIVNSSATFLSTKAIHLKRGTLSAYYMMFTTTKFGSIYVEKDAELLNMTILVDNLFWDHVFISAHSEGQVNVGLAEHSTREVDVSSLIWYRKEAEAIGAENYVDFNANSTYCNSTTSTVICNFKYEIPVVKIDVNMTSLPDLETVFLMNVENVLLSPSCVTAIQLYNIKNITTVRREYGCSPSLVAFNSHFERLTAEMSEIELSKCSVNVFDPSFPLEVLNLRYTNISELSFQSKAIGAKLTDLVVERIRDVTVRSGVMEISRAKVGIIGPGGLSVSTGNMTIRSSIFSVFMNRGIVVNTDLVLRDCVIDTLEEGAIGVYEAGNLFMKNVTIRNGTLGSIKFYGSVISSLLNVTISGRLVKLDQKLSWADDFEGSGHTPALPNTSGSGIDLGLTATTTLATIQRPTTEAEPVPPIGEPFTTPRTTTSATSASVEAVSSNKIHDLSTPLLHGKSSVAQHSSLAWITAGIGFLIGLSIGLALILAKRVFRPRLKINFPSIRFQVRDDQRELLDAEELGTESRGRPLDYSSVPMSVC